MDDTPFSSLAVHATNPFKPEGDFRKYKESGVFKGGSFVDGDGVIGEGLVSVDTESRVHDRTLFVKFYEGGIRLLPKMSNAGMKFFSYIMLEVLNSHDKDYVILPVSKTLTICEYKESSRIIYYTTIKELIKMKVIAKKESYSRDHYWINPNMFFNGDRVKVFGDFSEYFKMKYEK